MKKIISSIIVIALLVNVAPLALGEKRPLMQYSNTLYVGGNGSSNYSTIQDAIDATSDGDTVFVFSGTYYENIVVHKSINLLGENKNTVIINGNDNGDVVNITANSVKISGFTIKNSTYMNSIWDGCGVRILSDGNIIENNIFTDNQDGIHNGYTDPDAGWRYYAYNHTIIRNNVFF